MNIKDIIKSGDLIVTSDKVGYCMLKGDRLIIYYHLRINKDNSTSRTEGWDWLNTITSDIESVYRSSESQLFTSFSLIQNINQLLYGEKDKRIYQKPFELTMQEIADKFNIPVEQLKIKE